MPRPEILCAVPTLFTDDGALDLPANRALHDRLRPHLDGVFVAGTTGEFPALSDDERLALFELSLDVWGAERVIAHVGSPATSQAVGLTRRAVDAGVTRLAALPPSYFAVDESDVRSHYAAVREAAGGAEVNAYLFAERTGVDMSPALLAQLVTDGSVSGAKVSGADVERIGDFVAAVEPGSVWAGADAALPAVTAAGARGVVAGLAAVAPAAMADLATAVAAGDRAATDGVAAVVLALGVAIGGWPAGLKTALALQDIGTAHCRMLQGPASRIDPTTAASALSAL